MVTKRRACEAVLVAIILTALGCLNKPGQSEDGAKKGVETHSIVVTKTFDANGILLKESAISIACDDAKIPKEQFERYVVKATLKENIWQVTIGFRDIHVKGGGFTYTIDGHTGKITSKILEQ